VGIRDALQHIAEAVKNQIPEATVNASPRLDAPKLVVGARGAVIKVEPPEGDPLRRWSSSGAAIERGGDGALFSFLAGSKHSVIADPEVDSDIQMVGRLLATADAVVWSAGSKLAEHQSFRPAAILRAHPQLTVTSITPFGLDGPWRDRAATPAR